MAGGALPLEGISPLSHPHHRKRPQENPLVYSHAFVALRQEGMAIASLARFLWPLVLLLLAGVFVLFYLVRPLPPQSIRLATGQPQSSLENLGKRYAEYLFERGIKVELITTSGARENIELLKRGEVDVALSIGGIAQAKDIPTIRSLGSVEYQPFWLFYHSQDETISPADFFQTGRFSVNIAGSGTRTISNKVLRLHGIDIHENPRFFALSSQESTAAFSRRELDGVFLVAGIHSRTIESLLNDPAVRLLDFTLAKAYTKHLKFLEEVEVPQGALDVQRHIPAHDVKMAATTTTVLAQARLHPVVQYLLLAATKEQDRAFSFFQRPGGFPAYVDQEIPLSDTAQRYYTKGLPALHGEAPYWLTTMLDRLWFMLFAILAIMYPLTKIFTNLRSFYAGFCIVNHYEHLEELELALSEVGDSAEKLSHIEHELNELDARITQLWVPARLYSDYFLLKNAFQVVRTRMIETKARVRARLRPAPAAPPSN